MGCLSFTLTRIGGVAADPTRVGAVSVSLVRRDGISVSFVREDGISVSFVRKGGMACRMGLVCKPNIKRPYLEIEPELIWVYPDWATDNNVYSNTHWNVN